jgi:hypothetical protein
MNSRDFFTAALLSCHKVLMEATLPANLPDNDDELDNEIVPIAEKAAKIAALYAAELQMRWQACMAIDEKIDRADPDALPSTKNLTKPDIPSPSKN